jgi:hypothetical protein
VAGDREMNLTDDEAAELGYAVRPRPRPLREPPFPARHGPDGFWEDFWADPPGPGIVALIVVVVFVVIVLTIYSNLRVSPGREAQDTAQQQQQSAPSRPAEEAVDAHKDGVKAPEVAIETAAPRVEYLPTGWEWAQAGQDTQLFDAHSVRIGYIPQGTQIFFALTATAPGQLVVAKDGSFWGYVHARWSAPVQRKLELRPEWHKAAAVIQSLTAQGHLQQLPPKSEGRERAESETILPEGYGYGCVGSIPGDKGPGQWLLSISRQDGRVYRVAFMPNGTCLVLDLSANPVGYRKVASLDGRYKGYAWFPGWRRPRMTPEMKRAIEVIKTIS